MEMLTQEMKRHAAEEALGWISPDIVLGVGTGTTANHFIDALVSQEMRPRAVVASSEATSILLQSQGIVVSDLNDVGGITVYVDGADEVDADLHLIKGGGGALTREKICAAAAEVFVCIADESKLVDRLGTFPLAVEVIPMALSHVARDLATFGGVVRDRDGFVTDNGNLILDIEGLDLSDPKAMETQIEEIAGVITCGIFAKRGADVLLLGTKEGVRRLDSPAQ